MLNNLDGAILQIIVLLTALPLLDDNFNSPIIVPIRSFGDNTSSFNNFITMGLCLHKDHLKKLVCTVYPKILHLAALMSLVIFFEEF